MTENIHQWFDANLLALNIQKIVFSCILLHRQKLPCSDRAPNIQGIHIPPIWPICSSIPWGTSRLKLSFKWFIESTRLKVSRGLGIIRKLKRVFPFSILRLLYFSLIYPYLCYCSSVWMSIFRFLLTPLHNLELKSAKVLQSTTHICVELLKIKDIHTLHLSLIAFQNFRGNHPSSFSGLPELIRNVSPYETRNQDDVLVPSTPTVRSDFRLMVAVGRT